MAFVQEKQERQMWYEIVGFYTRHSLSFRVFMFYIQNGTEKYSEQKPKR